MAKLQKNFDLNNWTFCCFMTYTFWEKTGMLSPFQMLTFQSQTSQNTAHICCILRRGWGVCPSLMERKGSLLPTSGHHLVKWLICHLPGRMLDPVRQKKGRCNCSICSGTVVQWYVQKHLRYNAKMQVYPQETHLYPEASEAGNLDVRVAGQVGASDIVRTL